MIIVAWTVMGFAALQLLVALVNFLVRQPLGRTTPVNSPLVSVLIPARNEEDNLPELLSGLERQPYPHVEILVFDDQSEDRTAELVARRAAVDSRFRLIRSEGLPGGWLGKNHACHRLAAAARGEYFLFLDADVRVHQDLIGGMVAFAQRSRTGLASVFPVQVMKSAGEWFTVPVMNYILLTLLPLVLVRKSGFASLAAANGQCMFFDRTSYLLHRPHEKMKSNKVEDIEIARFYKRQGIPVACLAGDGRVTCRMYRSFGGAVNGFSKNVACFFGNSFTLAILFWLMTTLGFIPLLFALGLKALLVYAGMAALTNLLVSAASHQRLLPNLLLWPVHRLVLGCFIYSALKLRIKKNHQWKGRNIA